MPDDTNARNEHKIDPDHPGFDMDWSWAKGQDLVWGGGRNSLSSDDEEYVVLPRAMLLDLVAVHDAIRRGGTYTEVRSRIPAARLELFDHYTEDDEDEEEFSPPGVYIEHDWPHQPDTEMQYWAPREPIETFGRINHDHFGMEWAVLDDMEDLVPFFERAGAKVEYDGALVERAFGFERG